MAAEVGGGSGLVGLMVSGFGAGAVIAAFSVERIRELIGRQRAATAGLATLAAAIGAFAFSEVPAYAVATMVLAGGGFIVAITSVTTQLQERVPDPLRGRVLGGRLPRHEAVHGVDRWRNRGPRLAPRGGAGDGGGRVRGRAGPEPRG